MRNPARSLSCLILSFALLSGCATLHTQGISIEGMPQDAPVQNVAMTVESYKFTPSEIRVKAGTHLVLGITSLGSKHEIKIKEFGIHRTIPAGETVTVELYAAEPGEFRFGCHLGLGFHYLLGMKGILIVEE